jgi:hypothetical protein
VEQQAASKSVSTISPCVADDIFPVSELIIKHSRPSGTDLALSQPQFTVIDYPDGRLITIRYKGVDLPYRTFDKRPQVNQAAIVENKRLGPILAYIAEQQKKLDMSRSAKAPRRRGQKNHMFKVG